MGNCSMDNSRRMIMLRRNLFIYLALQILIALPNYASGNEESPVGATPIISAVNNHWLGREVKKKWRFVCGQNDHPQILDKNCFINPECFEKKIDDNYSCNRRQMSLSKFKT